MDTKHALAAERTVAVWHVEIAVAALLALAGVAVMADSVRVGIGWGVEGPQAGFFPFYVGLILLGAATATLVRNLIPRLKDRENFVDRTSLRRVLSVLLPIIVYVALVPWTGLYLASALLIMFFMRAHGRFRLLTCLGIAVSLMVGLFALFELWFLVPLPKGPIETALGF
jgi:hypothetical protein